MKIAIVGAGLAGVAAAWELAAHGEVDLWDPKGIAGGASGVAPGLLHLYGGVWAKKSLHADEGLAATRRLLAPFPDTYEATGILRVASSSEQAAAFLKTSRAPDVEWVPGALNGLDGIVIRSGITVRIQPYLKGLFEKSGATLIRQAVDSLDELQHYDRIVLATGASPSPSPDPALHSLKGQVLRLKWPKTLEPPPMSVIGKKYLVMSQDRTSCLVGATFEHTFTNPGPDLESARAQLIPPIAELYPELADAPILECRAGIRATTCDRKPRLERVTDRIWSLRGLGSKGLLFHALYARNLAAQMFL